MNGGNIGKKIGIKKEVLVGNNFHLTI